MFGKKNNTESIEVDTVYDCITEKYYKDDMAGRREEVRDLMSLYSHMKNEYDHVKKEKEEIEEKYMEMIDDNICACRICGKKDDVYFKTESIARGYYVGEIGCERCGICIKGEKVSVLRKWREMNE